MAIIFEQQRKPINWIAILTIAFSAGFIIFAAYFLFFAVSPQIEIVLPAPLLRASQISNLEFKDPGEIVNSPAFRRLGPSQGAPTKGTLGRPNPFLPF